MSLKKYICEPVRNCMAHLAANYSGRFKMGYDSKQDVSPELELDAASYFQTVIGIFEWMTALGKINILDELLLFEMRFYH